MAERDLSAVASTAEAEPGGKLFAPAAARNAGPLTELMRAVAPARGRALEIASGTGQHVVAFAQALPGLTWQPTEINAARRAAIAARLREAGLANIRPVRPLDAAATGWSAAESPCDLIVAINLLHLISAAEAANVIREAAHALAPGGTFVLYGPFLRGGELTSAGDAEFHARLTAQDPEIGYKDDFDTMDLLQAAGLEMAQVVEMPANNLALVAVRRR